MSGNIYCLSVMVRIEQNSSKYKTCKFGGIIGDEHTYGLQRNNIYQENILICRPKPETGIRCSLNRKLASRCVAVCYRNLLKNIHNYDVLENMMLTKNPRLRVGPMGSPALNSTVFVVATIRTTHLGEIGIRKLLGYIET